VRLVEAAQHGIDARLIALPLPTEPRDDIAVESAAAQRLKWRPNAAKAVLLMTDAPPHEKNVAATIEAAQPLRSRGVQIVPVAASGVDDTAQYVLRTMAALAQGRYIFLTDDSGVGDEHAEPGRPCPSRLSSPLY